MKSSIYKKMNYYKWPIILTLLIIGNILKVLKEDKQHKQKKATLTT